MFENIKSWLINKWYITFAIVTAIVAALLVWGVMVLVPDHIFPVWAVTLPFALYFFFGSRRWSEYYYDKRASLYGALTNVLVWFSVGFFVGWL